jgi:cell division protein FtsQ
MRPSNRKILLGEGPTADARTSTSSATPSTPTSATRAPKAASAPKARPRATSPKMAKLLAVGRAVVGLVLVVGLAGGVAFSARKYVKNTPRFAISEIVVVGAKHRHEDEIVALSGLLKGKNVFSTDLDAARTQLLGDPWVKDARLERRLPGTVTITVEERKAAGIVAAGDTYLVSPEGEIWKRLEPGDPTDLPIVTGVSVQMITEDRKGAEAQVRRALELGAEYERTQLAKRSPLQEIHVTGTGASSLVVGKSGITLALGDAPFRRKLDQAARVVAELDKRGAKADAILLDDEARPDRVVVRMR